jgi:hypothetical protein
MNEPRVIYYQARPDLTVNDLPIFFGRVELQNGKVNGKHYRARIDQLKKNYIIGYYWLEQEADQFLRKFQDHGDSEITEDDFNRLLNQWTRNGQNPPFCWNPDKIGEIQD